MQYCTVLYWTVASLRHATYRYSTVPVQYCTGSGFGPEGHFAGASQARLGGAP